MLNTVLYDVLQCALFGLVHDLLSVNFVRGFESPCSFQLCNVVFEIRLGLPHYFLLDRVPLLQRFVQHAFAHVGHFAAHRKTEHGTDGSMIGDVRFVATKVERLHSRGPAVRADASPQNAVTPSRTPRFLARVILLCASADQERVASENKLPIWGASLPYSHAPIVFVSRSKSEFALFEAP